jgi:hypothetical protein
LMVGLSSPTDSPMYFAIERGPSPAPWIDFDPDDVQRPLGLPGLTSAACGHTWAQVGVCLPSAALPDDIAARLVDPWPVPLGAFRLLRADVAVYVPEAASFPPGGEFGSLVGSIKGSVAELVWVTGWTLLFNQDVLTALQPRNPLGFKLPLSEVKVEGAPEVRLSEPEVPYIADIRLDPSTPPACPTCGQRSVKVPDALVLERDPGPEAPCLFRGRELTTLLFCNAAFRDLAMELGWRGAKFTPVPVGESPPAT